VVPRPESSPDHASLGTIKTWYSESAAHAALAKPLPPGVHPAGVQYRMVTNSGGKSLSLSAQTRRGSGGGKRERSGKVGARLLQCGSQ
jgi:hypothetical protein